MLTWLNSDPTRGMAVSKGEETLSGKKIFGPRQRRDHLGEE